MAYDAPMKLDDRQLWMTRLREDRDWQFWLFQFLGWSGYSLVTFFTLTVWDENVSWAHVGHILLQGLFGILCSWPLRSLYGRIFDKRPMMEQAVYSSAAIIAVSLIWTAVRLQTFASFSGEIGLWREFNDWFFGSLFVFSSWTAF